MAVPQECSETIASRQESLPAYLRVKPSVRRQAIVQWNDMTDMMTSDYLGHSNASRSDA